MANHTDLTDIDLPTLQEMFRDIEEENLMMSKKLTSIGNDLAMFWPEIRELRGDSQTWEQCWRKKKENNS